MLQYVAWQSNFPHLPVSAVVIPGYHGSRRNLSGARSVALPTGIDPLRGKEGRAKKPKELFAYVACIASQKGSTRENRRNRFARFARGLFPQIGGKIDGRQSQPTRQ